MKIFQNMHADENKEIYDLSNHNLIEISAQVNFIKKRKNLWKITEYISNKEEHLDEFIVELENRLENLNMRLFKR